VLTFVVVAAVVTLLISSVAGWWFFVVVLGFAVLALYLAVQTAKPGAGAAASPVAQSGPRFDPGGLAGNYRLAVERAQHTHGSIQRAIAECADPGLRRALSDATRDTDELVQIIYDLALKAQSVHSALNSSSDMARLSNEIQQLDTNIKGTNDEFQKSQYYATLDGKLQQMQNFTDIKVALERWDAQLDNAMSTLDTILSQVLRIRSSEMLSFSDATDQVSRSLRDEVDNLKATSDALDSLYSRSK
jgi:hypothetical protein